MMTVTTVLYGVPFQPPQRDYGFSAYAIGYPDPGIGHPWWPVPVPSVNPPATTPVLPGLPAPTLVERCKQRAAELRAALALVDLMRAELETLEAMIAAAEKSTP